MFHGSVDGVHCAKSVQICYTAITFGGIKNAISAVIELVSTLGAVAIAHINVDPVRIGITRPVGVVAYFTSSDYFTVVVNFRLLSVEHLDYVAFYVLPLRWVFHCNSTTLWATVKPHSVLCVTIKDGVVASQFSIAFVTVFHLCRAN